MSRVRQKSAAQLVGAFSLITATLNLAKFDELKWLLAKKLKVIKQDFDRLIIYSFFLKKKYVGVIEYSIQDRSC